MAYTEYGRGEPLVPVHGSASDYRTWHNQQEEFAGRHRVITYSRRYHWPNERISEEASHIMHEDNASAYNKAVQSFLEKHRRTA
ncbi:MAG: alpha/beta fold hydrolase [bacterium]